MVALLPSLLEIYIGPRLTPKTWILEEAMDHDRSGYHVGQVVKESSDHQISQPMINYAVV